MLVIHAVRPDRLLASSHRLVAATFGDEFMQEDKVVNLREIVENEVTRSDYCLYYLWLYRQIEGTIMCDLFLEIFGIHLFGN